MSLCLTYLICPSAFYEKITLDKCMGIKSIKQQLKLGSSENWMFDTRRRNRSALQIYIS